MTSLRRAVPPRPAIGRWRYSGFSCPKETNEMFSLNPVLFLQQHQTESCISLEDLDHSATADSNGLVHWDEGFAVCARCSRSNRFSLIPLFLMLHSIFLCFLLPLLPSCFLSSQPLPSFLSSYSTFLLSHLLPCFLSLYSRFLTFSSLISSSFSFT